MQNKKRFIIIAIILFIFLGLTIFTFANPADEQIKEQENGNENIEKVKDKEEDKNSSNIESNDKETEPTNEPVIRVEPVLNQNMNVNMNTNDTEVNVPNDDTIVDDSYEKALAAVIVAEEKLEDLSYESALELVNKVNNSEKKYYLDNRLVQVKNNIDAKKLVANLESKTTNASNKVEMDFARAYREDEEIISKVAGLSNQTLKDELELKLAELAKLLDDLEAPKFNFNNGKIVSEFTVKVDDENFDYMTITNMNTGEVVTIYVPEYELPGENADNLRYDIIAYDKAKNETKKMNIYIDNTNPVINGIGIVGSEELDLINNGIYKKVTLRITDGSLKKVVRVTDSGEEILMGLEDNYNSNKLMSYENVFDVDGTYIIKAIDRLGNSSEINFTIDNTPAKVLSSNILVLGDPNEQKEFYAKNGDTIYAYIRLSEKLLNTPVFTLNNNGKSYVVDTNNVIVSEANTNGEYTYSIKYLINKDVDMTDGEITVSVSGINDLAGNNTDDVLKPTNGHIVYLDRTVPEVVSVEQVYEDKENGRIKTTVIFSEKVEFPVSSLNWRKVSDTEYYTYFYRTKDYTVNFKDLADNLNSYTISIDNTAPEVVSVDQVYEDKENGRIKTTVVFSEPVQYPFDSLNWRRVSDIEYFTYFYKTKNYTIDFKDLIGNPNSYTISIDKDAPIVKLFMKGKEVEAGKWYTSTIKAYIEDANEYTAILRDHKGNEVTYISGTDITSRANYTLEVTDKIGNKTVIEFGIDKDYPLVYLNGKKNEKVKSDVQYFNKDVEIKVADLNLDSVVFTKNGKEIDFENNIILTEEGSYTLLAIDKANNKTKVNFVIDKTYPTITVSNGSIGDEEYSKLNLKIFDANTVAKVVINGKELAHKGKYVDINDGDAYKFIEGENVVEITDKAGNVTTQTFIVDKTAPEYKAMAILPASSTGVAYAKNGTKITINAQFYEKLATKPELKINGKVVENAFNNGVQRGEVYIYSAYYTITEEDQDGEIQVEVYGYADKAGNVGNLLTNEQLNIGGQKKVVVDKTAPKILIDKKVELNVGDEFIDDIYAKISDNFIDASDLKVEIYPVNGVKVDTAVPGTYQINYKISDKVGNFTVETRTIIVK